MVDMQHLHEVVQYRHNPRLDLFCKNVLYGNFRSQGGVENILRDPSSVKRIGHEGIGPLNARGYLEHLERVRQVQNPSSQDFIYLLYWVGATVQQMLNEARSRDWEDEDECARKDRDIQDAAEEDLSYVQQFYNSGNLKKRVEPDNSIQYGGIQMAKMLTDFMNRFEDIESRHIRYLMRRNSALDVLLLTMRSLDTTRASKTITPFTQTNANYLLFCEDRTGLREQEAYVVLDNRSLSVLDGTLTLNPRINMGGVRTSQDGQQWPYIEEKEFLRQTGMDAFLEVCLAYNLFDLTYIWFNEFGHLDSGEINWSRLQDDYPFEYLFVPEYKPHNNVTMKVFFRLVMDLKIAFGHAVGEPDAEQRGIHIEGDYHEASQAWKSRAMPVISTTDYYPPPEVYQDDNTARNIALVGAAVAGVLVYVNS